MCSTAHVSTYMCGCLCAHVSGQEYTFVCTCVCQSVCVQARLGDFRDSDKQILWVQADPLLAPGQKTLRSLQLGAWRSSLSFRSVSSLQWAWANLAATLGLGFPLRKARGRGG